MPQIVFIASSEGETLFLNQKWYDYTGLKNGDIRYESWNSVIHPDDLVLISKSWPEAREKLETWSQEYRLRRQDGVYRWHLGRSVPDLDEQGRLQHWIGTVTDIEVQKMAEKALVEVKENLELMVEQRTKELRQANSFLDTVIENIPNMIFVKDAENLKFVRFNRAGEDLLGLSRESLIGKGDYDFFPEAEALAFQKKDRAVIAGKIMVDIPEEQISTQSGVRTLHTKKLPISDIHGVTRYLLGISEDITDKKKIEIERLQFIEDQIESKEAQRTTERFKFLSEASALLGSTLDYELLLNNLTKLLVPSIADWCSVELLQPDRSLKQIAVAHQNPEKVKWAWELRKKFPLDQNAPSGPPLVSKTGKSQLIAVITKEMLVAAAINTEHAEIITNIGFKSYICSPIRARGKILGTLTLVSTEESNRTYTQADLHLAEDLADRAGAAVENAQLYKEASQLNRVKDEFLATLSHELRTPLNVILGHAEILSSESQQMTGEQIQQSIDAIFRNAKTQTGLIDDLLNVSSIITGKVSYKPTEVVPDEVVRNIVDSLKKTALAKDVKLNLDTSGAPKNVFADATRLHQIIWNLISNAIKFTPAAGKVNVVLSHTEKSWEICVTDTGRGIDPDFLPYVFDRFRQEDASTTRRYGGLGLGLSIVRHLTELHGGYVVAESKGKDHGSTFKVTLPLTSIAMQVEVRPEKNTPPQAIPKLRNENSLKDVKILLVEDSEDSRYLIRLILNRAGAQTVEAESAAEARHKLQGFQPDLIISDVGMADESGIEFIEKIRISTGMVRSTPAIALTAYVRAEEKAAIIKAGFQSHVGKPVATETLLGEIHKLLGNRI